MKVTRENTEAKAGAFAASKKYKQAGAQYAASGKHSFAADDYHLAGNTELANAQSTAASPSTKNR